jgi:hypothetical protein
MPLGTLPYKAQPVSHVWSEDSSLLTVTFDVFDSSTPQALQTTFEIGVRVTAQEDWPLVISRLQEQNQLLQIQQAGGIDQWLMACEQQGVQITI